MRNSTRDPARLLVREDRCCVVCKDGGLCGKSTENRLPFPMCPEHVVAVLRAYRREPEPIEHVRERWALWRVEMEHDAEREECRRQANAQRWEALEAQELVYYAELPGDRIKIGTTVNLAQRLSGLRIRPSAILATEPGGRDKEHLRHRQFTHLRMDCRREDFRPGADLLTHIEQVKQLWGEPTITTTPVLT